MAEPKVVTVIITVDLKCWYSAATIKCALCKLEMCFKINSTVFDEKKNTVTVTGPFDPHHFIHQLRCMAGSVIISVVIEPPPPPPPPPPLPPILCPPFPGPMWCSCGQFPCPPWPPARPHPPPHHCGCSSCGQFPCPSWPPARPQPFPCYKIVCEYGPCYGCSHK